MRGQQKIEQQTSARSRGQNHAGSTKRKKTKQTARGDVGKKPKGSVFHTGAGDPEAPILQNGTFYGGLADYAKRLHEL